MDDFQCGGPDSEGNPEVPSPATIRSAGSCPRKPIGLAATDVPLGIISVVAHAAKAVGVNEGLDGNAMPKKADIVGQNCSLISGHKNCSQ